MHQLREESALRDGAFSWGVRDGRSGQSRTGLTEWFLVESSAEHLRQHRRCVPNADADLQSRRDRVPQRHGAPARAASAGCGAAPGQAMNRPFTRHFFLCIARRA
ncbi:MFS transporter [Cupriavidus basilensis]